MRNAQARGHGSRRIEGYVESGNHTAENIDRKGDPWAPDRLARDVIHKDEIHFGVIDLDHAEWRIG